jgi:hypothetical protein
MLIERSYRDPRRERAGVGQAGPRSCLRDGASDPVASASRGRRTRCLRWPHKGAERGHAAAARARRTVAFRKNVRPDLRTTRSLLDHSSRGLVNTSRVIPHRRRNTRWTCQRRTSALPRKEASPRTTARAWYRPFPSVREPAAVGGPDLRIRHPVDLSGASGLRRSRASARSGRTRPSLPTQGWAGGAGALAFGRFDRPRERTAGSIRASASSQMRPL